MIKHKKSLKISFYEISKRYLLIQKKLNLSFSNNINQKIRIGIICYSIKNGGIERLVALLINYLYKVKIFNLYLITLIKETNEYSIEGNFSRTVIKNNTLDLVKTVKNKTVKKNKIEILIYNFYNYKEINILNKIKEFKVIILTLMYKVYII